MKYLLRLLLLFIFFSFPFCARQGEPSHFGENWDAFEECLSDLEWLPGEGLVLFVTRTDLVLEKAPDELSTWGDVLKEAAADWRSSHPSAPFHLVFHAERRDEAKAKARLTAAGLMSPR